MTYFVYVLIEKDSTFTGLSSHSWKQYFQIFGKES